MSKFKPMLAGKVEDLTLLNYPVIASPKIDGIRCLIIHAKALSRTMKEIPNRHIFNTLSGPHSFPGLDGELVIPDKAFHEVSGGVMTATGTPEFIYWVFDLWCSNAPYQDRLKALTDMSSKFPLEIKLLEWVKVHNMAELLKYEDHCLDRGFEGVMIRNPHGKYKYGRSTPKDQILLKLKRFLDSEAEVIGFIEEMHNGNEALKDAFGRTKRSSHQDNLVGKDTLGALHCRDPRTGIEFDIGTGFTHAQRAEIWQRRNEFLGKFVKYEHQVVGAKKKPRFPTFVGFRHKDDM